VSSTRQALDSESRLAVASATPAHANSSLGELQSVAVPQPTDGGNHVVSVKHLNQSAEQAVVVVWSRLEIFLEDTLGFANCLEGQFLIGHNATSLQSASRPGASGLPTLMQVRSVAGLRT
jgi:hypothetical protein